MTFARGSKRYAVRVTGPAGHSRYLCGCTDSTPAIFERDDERAALTYHKAEDAHELATYWQGKCKSVICDVVNLDDPEERC